MGLQVVHKGVHLGCLALKLTSQKPSKLFIISMITVLHLFFVKHARPPPLPSVIYITAVAGVGRIKHT